MLTFYHNPRCRKSREALQILQGSAQQFETIEYLKTPPTVQDLRYILKKLKLKPLELIRKQEPVYKEHRNKEYSDEEWIKLMVANPILIERPILMDGDRAVIGRPPQKIKEFM